jgi:hypothetical protein
LKLVTILTHVGIVLSIAGLFFGLLALIFGSPYGMSMTLISSGILGSSLLLAWFFGFSPLWRPPGWENSVTSGEKHFVVLTLKYPPYLTLRRQAPAFGTAVFLSTEDEVSEQTHPHYGLHWRDRSEAETGHRWVVETLQRAGFAELEPYQIPPLCSGDQTIYK